MHAVVAMSNHWHVCLSDPEGRVCEFTRDCHSFIARMVNAAHGDFESIWSNEQTSHVACVTGGDLMDHVRTQIVPAGYTAAVSAVLWTVSALVVA